MISIDRILVPIDFSPPSIAAIRYASAFHDQYRAELLLLHVVEDVHYVANPYLFEMPTLPPLEDVEEDREAELHELVREHFPGDSGVRPVLRRGKPFVEILLCAQEERADLIIIASHGHTGLEHVLFGSTAEKVIRKSLCPVLVVKQHIQQAQAPA